MRMINPRMSTFCNVGATTTVRMISPAIRNSRPSRMPRPRSCQLGGMGFSEPLLEFRYLRLPSVWWWRCSRFVDGSLV